MHPSRSITRAGKVLFNVLAVVGTLSASAVTGMLAVLLVNASGNASKAVVFATVAIGTAFGLVFAFKRLHWPWRAPLALLLLGLVLAVAPRPMCASPQAVQVGCG